MKSAQPASTLKDVVSLGPPTDQADLLAAHHSFLRGMAGLAAHAYPQARSNVPGDFVAFAVFLRLHRLAQSIQSLARAGYVREAQAIARGMVSACADLVFILEADTNARALAYALFSRRQRRRKGTAYKEIGLLRDYDRWDAQKTQEEDKLLASYRANGYEPASKLGGRDDTWTGLSDRDLIDRVGLGYWYKAFYIPFSDIAHANVMGANSEFEQLRKGRIQFGPLFDPFDLSEVLTATGLILPVALLAVNKHFKLRRTNQIRAARKKFMNVIGKYNEQLLTKHASELMI